MATAKTAPRAAKTATEAFDTFTTTSTETVRENIDRGIAAFSEASSFGKQNIEAWVASATAAQKGFETLSARAVAFQKAALENHVAGLVIRMGLSGLFAVEIHTARWIIMTESTAKLERLVFIHLECA